MLPDANIFYFVTIDKFTCVRKIQNLNFDPYLTFRGLIGGGCTFGRKFVLASRETYIREGSYLGGAYIQNFTVYFSYIQNRLFKY